jgi:hypothetical protein
MKSMKRAIAVPLAIMAAATSAFAMPSSQSIKGLDWLQLSLGERMEYILASMLIMTRHGVEFGKSINDYHDAVAEKLRTHPDLYYTDVTNILASIVYEWEPGTRVALDKLRN